MVAVRPHHLQDVRLVIVVTKHGRGSRDTEDKNLLRSCEKKSTQNIGNDFCGLDFVFSRCGHRFDCMQGSFVQVRFLGNVVCCKRAER